MFNNFYSPETLIISGLLVVVILVLYVAKRLMNQTKILLQKNTALMNDTIRQIEHINAERAELESMIKGFKTSEWMVLNDLLIAHRQISYAIAKTPTGHVVNLSGPTAHDFLIQIRTTIEILANKIKPGIIKL